MTNTLNEMVTEVNKWLKEEYENGVFIANWELREEIAMRSKTLGEYIPISFEKGVNLFIEYADIHIKTKRKQVEKNARYRTYAELSCVSIEIAEDANKLACRPFTDVTRFISKAIHERISIENANAKEEKEAFLKLLKKHNLTYQDFTLVRELINHG